MAKRLTTVIVALLALLAAAPSALAYSWDVGFKEAVILASLEFAPSGLRARLPKDAAAARPAALQIAELTRQGKRDADEHAAHVKALLRDPNADPARLLAELGALTAYYVDKTAPEASRTFYQEVDRSRAFAAARFAGYQRIEKLSGMIALIKASAEPWRAALSKAGSAAPMDVSPQTGDKLAELFDLFVNVSVDLWCTLAADAGVPLGEGKVKGAAAALTNGEYFGGLFKPTDGADATALTRAVFEAARQAGLTSELDVKPAPGADEFVFDEGERVSGDEAKRAGNQLQTSHVTVDSGGVDRLKGLDPETLAALERLGIDVKSGSRSEFRGTRGGVQPGQIVKAGDLEFKINSLQSVEIGSRDKKQVYMQLPDSAMGSAASAGQLNQKAVVAVISANVGAFKTCFERRLREKPDLSGRVFVQFTIATDGAVGEVKLVENTTNDGPFAECISRQVQRLRFPPPKGGEVVFVFPFIFEQAYSF